MRIVAFHMKPPAQPVLCEDLHGFPCGECWVILMLVGGCWCFRGGNSVALASRVWFCRFVRICFGGWLVAVRVVAICCWAVGVRRVHERLALGGWHCLG